MPVVCLWKNPAERRRIDSYKSFRRSVIMEAGMIHQIRSGVIEDALQNCGSDLGNKQQGPGIMEVCGDKFSR